MNFICIKNSMSPFQTKMRPYQTRYPVLSSVHTYSVTSFQPKSWWEPQREQRDHIKQFCCFTVFTSVIVENQKNSLKYPDLYSVHPARLYKCMNSRTTRPVWRRFMLSEIHSSSHPFIHSLSFTVYPDPDGHGFNLPDKTANISLQQVLYKLLLCWPVKWKWMEVNISPHHDKEKNAHVCWYWACTVYPVQLTRPFIYCNFFIHSSHFQFYW